MEIQHSALMSSLVSFTLENFLSLRCFMTLIFLKIIAIYFVGVLHVGFV